MINMSREQERGLSKINNWVDSKIYKEARIIAICLDLSWKEALEEALELFIEKHTQAKED